MGDGMKETPTRPRPVGIYIAAAIFLYWTLSGAVHSLREIEAHKQFLDSNQTLGASYFISTPSGALFLTGWLVNCLFPLVVWGLLHTLNWARRLGLFLVIPSLLFGFGVTRAPVGAAHYLSHAELLVVMFAPILIVFYLLLLDRATVAAFRKTPKNQESK